MGECLYNISPNDHHMMYSGEEIRKAAKADTKLYLDLRPLGGLAKVRLAATVSGWCTVCFCKNDWEVNDDSVITQEWAGSFMCA